MHKIILDPNFDRLNFWTKWLLNIDSLGQSTLLSIAFSAVTQPEPPFFNNILMFKIKNKRLTKKKLKIKERILKDKIHFRQFGLKL